MFLATCKSQFMSCIHAFSKSPLHGRDQQFSMHAPCLCEGLAHCNNHQCSHSTVSSITAFSTSIFAQIVCQVRFKKRDDAKPGLRAMHAVCPAMLAQLAFDLKKMSISLWPLLAGCMQLPLLLVQGFVLWAKLNSSTHWRKIEQPSTFKQNNTFFWRVYS